MKIPVHKIAELANIELTPEEEARLAGELDRILGFVEEMNAIPGLEAIQPTSHPLSAQDVYREDVAKDQGTAKDVLKYAPDAHGEFFHVPKVIEQDA